VISEEVRDKKINEIDKEKEKEKVLEAMLRVQRHRFVPESEKRAAYTDTPLDIGDGQTISAPHMVAIMCELLKLSEGHKVLEIEA
jgi:protein-L-isoaspartate(D-aspartate) O-methyltransferase